MPYDVAFNFRSTLGYVTDGANQAFDGGGAYPRSVTVNGTALTVGWSADLTSQSRDRYAAAGPETAGIVFSSAGHTFRISGLEAGSQSIYLALGDATNSNALACDVLDSNGSTVLFAVSNPSVINEYLDAMGTLHSSPANWAANQQPRTITLSGDTVYLRLPGPTNNPICHVRIVKSSGPTDPTGGITRCNGVGDFPGLTRWVAGAYFGARSADVRGDVALQDWLFDSLTLPGGLNAALADSNDALTSSASVTVSAVFSAADATDVVSSTLFIPASGVAADAALVDADDALSASLSVGVKAAAALADDADAISSLASVAVKASASLVDADDLAAVDADVGDSASLNAVDATDALTATVGVLVAVNAALVDDADVVVSTFTVVFAGGIIATASLVDADDALSASLTASIAANASLIDGDDLASADADVSSSASLNAVDATDVMASTLSALVRANAALADDTDGVSSTFSVVTPGGVNASASLVDDDDILSASLGVDGEAPFYSGGHVDTSPRPRPQAIAAALTSKAPSKDATRYVETLKADLEAARLRVDEIRRMAEDAKARRDAERLARKAAAGKSRAARKRAQGLSDQLAAVKDELAADIELQKLLDSAEKIYQEFSIRMEEIDVAYVALVLSEC